MIKLTFCLIRLPHLTRAEFQDYWLNHHGPLVASVKDALRIRRYVQTHSVPAEFSAALRATRGAPEDYDGVAELWWDSFESMGQDEAATQASALLLEDEKKFIDLARSPLWWGREHVIVDQ
ncbi:MAG: EthD domain-containing protein [Caulobacteraceae bacterium]